VKAGSIHTGRATSRSLEPEDIGDVSRELERGEGSFFELRPALPAFVYAVNTGADVVTRASIGTYGRSFGPV
jgi:hypothetical protein